MSSWTLSPRDPDVGRAPRSVAFVDESMRRIGPSTVCYLMAAAVLEEAACEATRDTLRPLARATTKRIHWRDEQQPAKKLIVKTLQGLDFASVVVIGAMIDRTKQERARQLVLKNLLFELDQRDVSLVLLESRHAERDRHDLRSIGQFRNAKYVSPQLTVTHGQPVQEPLLWLPDVLAGVVGDHRCGQNQLFEVLRDLIHLRDLGSL